MKNSVHSTVNPDYIEYHGDIKDLDTTMSLPEPSELRRVWITDKQYTIQDQPICSAIGDPDDYEVVGWTDHSIPSSYVRTDK